MTEIDPVDVHVGDRLRHMRKAHRLSLQAVGTAVGVSYQQAQKYETGFNRISASMLWQIAGVLDVDVGYFFEGLDVMPDDKLPAAETLRTAAALGRIEPAVRQEIRGLIQAIAAAGDESRV